MNRISSLLLTIALFVVCSVAMLAQTATGAQPLGSLGGGPDLINNGNLNVHWSFPVFARKGRDGMNFSYALSYDSAIWYPATSNGVTTWQAASNFGWRGVTEAATGYLSSRVKLYNLLPQWHS